MLSNPSPRPARCYDPSIAPHRDELGVHLYDYPTIRTLLRDPQRVTSDVSEMLSPEQRDQLHPVSCFVWATDRKTISGCPGRHAALRSVMAPWFGAPAVTERRRSARAACEQFVARQPDGLVDLYQDYALPLVVTYMAEWLGIDPSDVNYAVDDQLASGDTFDDWPPLAPPGMDEHYRSLMARPHLRGLAAAARDLVGSGVITERESWGMVYSISVSSVATAATITLTAGLSVEHGLWRRMTEPEDALPAIEEAVRLGNPFPQASRFAREPFTVGEVDVEPGEQVLMWLTAANRDLPGPHEQPLDRFDPSRANAHLGSGHLGWGSGYHLCGGVHHARAIAEVAVTTLAQLCPDMDFAGPWTRWVGIDDGYRTAPVTVGTKPTHRSESPRAR